MIEPFPFASDLLEKYHTEHAAAIVNYVHPIINADTHKNPNSEYKNAYLVWYVQLTVAIIGKLGLGPIVPTENMYAAVHNQNIIHPEIITTPNGGNINIYGVPFINYAVH